MLLNYSQYSYMRNKSILKTLIEAINVRLMYSNISHLISYLMKMFIEHHHIWLWQRQLKCIPNTIVMVRRLVSQRVHGVNMGPTWVLLAPDGPHVGPMNLAIRGALLCACYMLTSSIPMYRCNTYGIVSCQHSPFPIAKGEIYAHSLGRPTSPQLWSLQVRVIRHFKTYLCPACNHVHTSSNCLRL